MYVRDWIAYVQVLKVHEMRSGDIGSILSFTCHVTAAVSSAPGSFLHSKIPKDQDAAKTEVCFRKHQLCLNWLPQALN